jgi:integrase
MATHYEYHGAWFIQWTEKGERKKEWIGRTDIISEREAKLKAKAKEIELSTGKVVFSNVPVLSEFIPEYLSWHEREYPASFYRIEQLVRDHLEPAFGHLPMDLIKSKPVEDYKHERTDKGAKSGTVTKELRTLKAMLNRALDWEVLSVMPLRRVSEPKNLDSKPPDFYTVKQLALIYEADPDYRYVWQLFANTGLRRSEGHQLRKTEVHRNFIRVLSSEEERTKSALWRDVPITNNARKALRNIDGADGYVLPRIRKESLSRAAERAVENAGLVGSLHTFRHTYCSHLVMAGVPLRTVQKLAGHAHYSTTEKYAHLAPGHMQKFGKAINL